MDILAVALGLLGGIFLTALIAWLWYQSRTVSKKMFDDLQGRYNETSTMLRISDEKWQRAQTDAENFSRELGLREQRLSEMTADLASRQTTIQGQTDKLNELQQQLVEQANINRDQQSALVNMQETLAKARALYSALQENFTRERETNEKQTQQITELTGRVNKLTAEHSTLDANNKALSEKLSTQKEEIEALQTKARIEFENIANKILEEKSGKFTEANKQNLEALLKPLGENIDTFKKKVEEVYEKESKQRFSLEEKVKDLIEQTNKISNEANNLATALKGQVKKQGDWGEMILESILEKSGLTRGREYTIQENVKDESGKNQRPDVIVHLPENRKIIIDSKVSMVAYDKFSSAETPDAQKIALKEHIQSLYNHVDLLAPKRYDLMDGSLDFVMMFIPIEPAYLTAIQADTELWSYAYNKRILLISPTNLIAALKLVSDLWKREMQNRNALEIAKQGEKLYEKFVGFIDTMEDVGRHIGKTQEAYGKAIGQLKDGRGNLVGQALKLRQLGIKSEKAISPGMLPLTEEESEAED